MPSGPVLGRGMAVLDSTWSVLDSSCSPILTREADGDKEEPATPCHPWGQFVLSLYHLTKEAWILLRPLPILKRLKTPEWKGHWDEETNSQ